MAETQYRGYGLTPRSIVGGVNIDKDGEFVDFVFGGYTEARYAVDQIIEDGEGS